MRQSWTERRHFLCVAFERENVATLMQHTAHRLNFLQLTVTKPDVSHLFKKQIKSVMQHICRALRASQFFWIDWLDKATLSTRSSVIQTFAVIKYSTLEPTMSMYNTLWGKGVHTDQKLTVSTRTMWRSQGNVSIESSADVVAKERRLDYV